MPNEPNRCANCGGYRWRCLLPPNMPEDATFTSLQVNIEDQESKDREVLNFDLWLCESCGHAMYMRQGEITPPEKPYRSFLTEKNSLYHNNRQGKIGPSYLVTVWHDATDDEMQEIADLLTVGYPEEDMGHFLVVREGVNLLCLDDEDVSEEYKIIVKSLTRDGVDELKAQVEKKEDD